MRGQPAKLPPILTFPHRRGEGTLGYAKVSAEAGHPGWWGRRLLPRVLDVVGKDDLLHHPDACLGELPCRLDRISRHGRFLNVRHPFLPQPTLFRLRHSIRQLLAGHDAVSQGPAPGHGGEVVTAAAQGNPGHIPLRLVPGIPPPTRILCW